MKLNQVFNKKKSEEEKQIDIIKNSEFFDTKWYLEKNPDVKARKISAARHYLRTGWKENRDPSPKFSNDKYLKEHSECRICPLIFEYNRNSFVDLAICAIMKNEGPYVKEWIDYHRLVGVKRFYIYDNESTDNMYQELLPYISQGIVVYKYYPGEARQVPAYNECLEEYRDKMQWLAYIDADEFIVPKEKKSIPEFLRDYKNCSGIGINWIIFDSNGHKEQPNGGVLENYTKVHYDDNWWQNHYIKSIVKIADLVRADVHNNVYKTERYAVDTLKNQIDSKGFIPNVSVDKIQVNHYYCKSEEEAKKKEERGIAIGKEIKPIKPYELNFREYKYDCSIYKYLYQLKPEIAKREKIKYFCFQILNKIRAIKYLFIKDEISKFIDSKWYFSQYPEARKSRLTAKEHYIQEGWKLGYNPSPLFNTKFYLEKHKDVAKTEVCPLLHYISNGQYEGRQSLPNVSPVPFVFKEVKSFKSFNLIRKSFQFLISPFIKTKNYIKNNNKFLSNIKDKDTTQSEFLDEKWYFAKYWDARCSTLSALEHYRTIGWKKGYNPSEKFNTLKYLKQYPECKICPLDFEYNRNGFVDLAVVMIMKNEGPYVKEWIDYHRLAGVKRFYIYDNDSTDSTKQILLPYIGQGIVVYKYYPGDAKQMPAYNDCIKRYKDKTQWLAIIDADEFIVPVEKNTIPEFLKDYEEYPGVGVDWVVYDSNGHKRKPKGGVLENYTRVHYDENIVPIHLIKSIVQPKRVDKIINPHFALFINDELAVNENKEEIGGVLKERAYISPFSINKIRINHYYCKSKEEAEYKVLRGTADGTGKKLIPADSLNFPEYKYDYSAYKFVVQLKPKIAKREKLKYAWLQVLNKIISVKYWFKRDEFKQYINEKWYFAQYPDAKESGLSAKEHYTQKGWKLGYNPSPIFDTNFYLEKYKDIAKIHICPLLHYIHNGKAEGRQPLPNYKPHSTLKANYPVTVITPTYNRLQYLEKAINMLKAQTLKNIRFIIIDDGSTDGSAAYIEEVTKDDNRFTVVKNRKNVGPSAARNKALPMVESEYVGFFDIDDEIPANYFEKLYQSAVKSNADIVFTNYNKEEHKIKSIISEADKYKALRNGAIWDKLYSAPLLQNNKIRFAEKLYTADNLFNIEAFHAANKIELVSEPRYLYELHGDSIGKDENLVTKRKKDIITICKKAMKFAKKKKFLPETKIALQEFLSFSYSCYQDDKVFCDELNTSLWGNTHHKAFYTARTYSKKEYELVAQSGYFNSKYYRWHNPCLWFSHKDLLDHYLSIGWLENRNPSPEFDGNKYLKDYPDIDKAGVNPLIHYVGHGMAEHRNNTPVISITEKVRYALEYPIRVKEEYDRLTAEIKALESMK